MEKGYKFGLWIMMGTIVLLQIVVLSHTFKIAALNNKVNTLEQQINQIHVHQANSAMRTNEFREKINGYDIPTAVQSLQAEINQLQDRVNKLEK